jgi:hypothetical protein
MDNIKIQQQSQFAVDGLHRIFECEIKTPAAERLQNRIVELIKGQHDSAEYRFLLSQLHQKFGLRQQLVHNVVCLRGRECVARRLAGDITYTGIINYGALGTSTTTPTENDTQLGAEVYRKTVADTDDADVASGIIVVSFFYATTDLTNSDLNEFASFIDGTASANSGRINNHVKFASAVNKTALKTLTIDSQFTIL